MTRININFAVSNYKDYFNNLNEYFYAYSDLTRESESLDYYKRENDIIKTHMCNYLMHNVNINNSLEIKGIMY
jgi:hypothetical protein